MSSSQSATIQRYFAINVEAALEELERAAEEEPFNPPAILANVAKLSGWNDPPDVLIVTPVSNKWEWKDGRFLLGSSDDTDARFLEPGIYDITATGITFYGTDETARQAHGQNSQFRVAVGWYTRPPN